MKARETVVTLVALLAIGVTSFFAYRYERKGETAGMCPFCDRTVHPGTAFSLEEGGHQVAACCPRCGLRAQVNQEQGKPAAAWATDFTTGQRIAAESATYVEGGDVEYCTHGDQPTTREPNGVSVRAYDRCLPALVAFKSPQEAGAYRQQHGGRLLSYIEALASVQKQ